MGKSVKKKQQAERINSLRKQYDAFLEEDKKRKERNDYILGRLDNMRTATVALRLRYNSLKPTEAPQSKHSVPNNFLQVTPVRNSILAQLNDETDESNILKEINKRFILIPRNNTLLNANFTHLKEKVDDVDWTSKYNILDQLKKSELEIDVTKENKLTKTTKENKICKKISFEESTDDEKDIDTSLSENICENENYENNPDINSYALKNGVAQGTILNDKKKNVFHNTSQISDNEVINDNSALNATNYNNSRLQQNQLKNTVQNGLEQEAPTRLSNTMPNKINKLQVEENKHETENIIQAEAHILADGIIKSLQESNTVEFDPGIQNNQHLIQPEIQDEIANKYSHVTTNYATNESHDGYYNQQPEVIKDISNEHSEILDKNYEQQNEKETRTGTQNPDYEEHNIVADTNYNNEPNEQNHSEHINQNYEETLVTDNNNYDENTIQRAELYHNQNYDEQNTVTDNNYYNQNDQQSDQYKNNLTEEPNQNQVENIEQLIGQYEQLDEQQNPNYEEEQIVADSNYYDENNQQLKIHDEQPIAGDNIYYDENSLQQPNYEGQQIVAENNYYDEHNQPHPNYDQQLIVADNNYYDENNQQADPHQQYLAEQPTTNYDEQNTVSENVYYDENGQQQANQYEQLAEHPISDYDEQPVAVENNYYNENNEQYSSEQPNGNYNEQYDENYQQQLSEAQGTNEEFHQNINEESVVESNEQLTQG